MAAVAYYQAGSATITFAGATVTGSGAVTFRTITSCDYGATTPRGNRKQRRAERARKRRR